MTTATSIQAEALNLRRLGWNVIAAVPRGKVPQGAWRRWQTERVTERLVRDAFAHGQPNLFIVTGAISRLAVLDCDDEQAIAHWRERLGAVLDQTTCVQTGRGAHYYFRLAAGQTERGRGSDGGDTGHWDIRAEGGGVIAPPSIHPSGRAYQWADERGPAALQDAPAELFIADASEPRDSNARSILSHLLANPPAEGGRNQWLAKVAGHFALHMPHQDAYEQLVRDAADRLTPPLPENEIAKLLTSIWQTEQAKAGKAAEPLAEDDSWRAKVAQPAVSTGWLVSGGTQILVQTRSRPDKDSPYELGLSAWLDADLHVLGVIDTDGDRIYEVEVRRPNGSVALDTLAGSVVSNANKLPAWLAKHGASIGPPDDLWPVRMREGSRLVRYLEAQEAPSMDAVPYLGWHDASRAFLTHEGVLRADGPAPYEAVRVHPAMREWAKYRYGTDAGLEVARSVLSRVLEFHDETVAAVFGSWWAAVLLKPQIQSVVSQFPFMAIEAASESGKTTGFFALMLQLSGHYAGQSNPTTAALRDALSANRSGTVWVDDLDDLEHHGELLRNVTVGGSLVKKGEDNHRQITAQMRAALVVSGEGLGLHGQKALIDRAILLSVPSPVGRLNRRGGPQWDDILDLKRECPDLTALAGSIVQLALQQEHQLKAISELRRGSSGRHADKLAIVRLGARILAAMVQENWLVECADTWVFAQKDIGAENALTLDILPAILRATGRLTRPIGPDPARRLPATPVFVEDGGTVWFSPNLVADWLRNNRARRSNLRLETHEAIADQARAMGLGGSRGDARRLFRYDGGGRSMYWRCSPTLSELLTARSEGDNGESEPDADTTQEDLF